MPYTDIRRIEKALESLKRFHAFFGVSFLSMKESGVPVGTPVTWGGPQENAFLDRYYRPPGAPPGKRYFVPYRGRPDPQHGYWRDSKYSGSTLQRARTTDAFSDAFLHPSKTKWAFAPGYLDVLDEQLPRDGSGAKIRLPVLDFAAWLYREVDLDADLRQLEARFRGQFSLTDDEFERLFDTDYGAESEEQFFFAEPADTAELIRVAGGVPEGPELGDLTEEGLVSSLETHIAESSLLSLPAGFVRKFYYSIKAQRFVVLAGRPGTGKTEFAAAFRAALAELFPGSVVEVTVSVGEDYGESDVIGYEKIAGGLAPATLSRELFISGRPRDIFVVILDEMNLSRVDAYLARLLPAIERDDATVELPGDDRRWNLPPDSYFVGTINSYIEEPTRVPLSGPVKRRSNIIEMPNILSAIVEDDDESAFAKLVERLLRQTLQRYQSKESLGLSSVLDFFRISQLEESLESDSRVLEPAFLALLWEIVRICASNAQTSLTAGVVQDMVDYVAISSSENPLVALDHQIAQKVVPQLSGPDEVPRQLAELVESKATEEAPFAESVRAFQELVDTADVGSKTTYYKY